jgi:predicted TIM-barrel fold metal-dependent hydrolase
MLPRAIPTASPSWAASIPTRGAIAGWKEAPGLLGMRFTFHTDILRQPLIDGRYDWVWGEMEKGGIPAMVLFHHEYMHLADRLAERYPGLRLVLDHLGLKSGKDVTEAQNFATLDKVLALAKRPNVAAKVSAMPCYADDKTYPFKSVHPHIRRVFDAFGPRRTFWGTDWSRLPCSYRQGVTMFTEQMPWLKGQDLDWVMGRGICEWIGWRI